jgi:hypothetical protein
MRSFLFAALIALCGLAPRLDASTTSVRGTIVDATGLPLPGVAVTLRPSAGPSITTTTGQDGTYTLDNVPPGRYDVEASLDAFEPGIRRNVDVTDRPITVDIELTLAAFRNDVAVLGDQPVDLIGSVQPDAPVTVTRTVMDVAMLPNSQADDVLTLIPNVVRGPDGLIAVAGARAQSAGLYINGADASDPVSGGAGVMLPLHAVDVMDVYAGGAPARFGGASGGLSAIQTRMGADHFRMELDGFFPRMLFGEEGGVAFWDPNLGFGGALARGRVSYQQAISYRYDRNTFTTLAGPDHSVFNALLSWTQLDARPSDNQRLRVSLGADPRETNRANITAFTPAAATPAVRQGGWFASGSDSLTARGLLLQFEASVHGTHASVTPHGSDRYVVSHDLVTGSYFDRQNRLAARVETGGQVEWSTSRHEFSAGGSLARGVLTQSLHDAAVGMLRSDGTPARVIEFVDTPAEHLALASVGLFAQDRWRPRPWLTVDTGVRYDQTANVSGTRVSPRAGWTMSLNADRTTFSGSAGVFTDRMPLAALAFAALPARQIVTFDTEGQVLTNNIVSNVRAPRLDVPQAFRWDAGLNQRLGPWLLRVRYEARYGTHELVVQPPVIASASGDPTRNDAVLASEGSSQARSLELTAGLRSTTGGELYVSYVRADTNGAQNSLDATEGLTRLPFVQANVSGPLPVDVPHRILAWGVIHLPSRFTVAPFLDARSGFPYTAIDDMWVMAGAPNAYRLPWTASLDLSTTRVMRLPHHLPDAGVGLKLYNVVSAHTEREVQRDIDRPDFGTRYDSVPRDFSFVFEFLWGMQQMR